MLLHPNRPYFLAPTGARRPPMWRAAASRNHQIARTYGPWPCQARRRPVKMSALQQVLTGRCVRLFPPLEGLRAGDFWVRVNPARRFPYRYSVSFASGRPICPALPGDAVPRRSAGHRTGAQGKPALTCAEHGRRSRQWRVLSETLARELTLPWEFRKQSKLAERVTATNSLFSCLTCAPVRSPCVIPDRYHQPSNL